MNLKGQNFRILLDAPGTGQRRVVAKSTSCTVTLTGNADDAAHKGITGMASAPVIVSKGWSVQVESLDVLDVVSIIAAIKNFVPFIVTWDETSTSNNQTALNSTFSRSGRAYFNDATFAFNDRTMATKSLQMTGTGPLSRHTEDTEYIEENGQFTMGQFVRLFIAATNTQTPKVIGAARQLSLHLSVTLEESTTKDTEGDWQIFEPTGYAFDITSNALMRSGEVITSQNGAQSLADIEGMYEAAQPVVFEIAFVSGANQRTKTDRICFGQANITNLTLNGPNRANADYNVTLNGFGELGTDAVRLVSKNFSTPISSAELRGLTNPQFVISEPLAAEGLVGKLVIDFGTEMAIVEESSDTLLIGTHNEDVATIQPDSEGTTWTITPISSATQTWYGIYII